MKSSSIDLHIKSKPEYHSRLPSLIDLLPLYFTSPQTSLLFRDHIFIVATRHKHFIKMQFTKVIVVAFAGTAAVSHPNLTRNRLPTRLFQADKQFNQALVVREEKCTCAGTVTVTAPAVTTAPGPESSAMASLSSEVAASSETVVPGTVVTPATTTYAVSTEVPTGPASTVTVINPSKTGSVSSLTSAASSIASEASSVLSSVSSQIGSITSAVASTTALPSSNLAAMPTAAVGFGVLIGGALVMAQM